MDCWGREGGIAAVDRTILAVDIGCWRLRSLECLGRVCHRHCIPMLVWHREYGSKGGHTNIPDVLGGCWHRKPRTGRLAARVGTRLLGVAHSCLHAVGVHSQKVPHRIEVAVVGSPAVGRSSGHVGDSPEIDRSRLEAGTLGRERGKNSLEGIGCMGRT